MSEYIEYQVRVYPNGTKAWYLEGKLHREDGPAIEYANGHKAWYLEGEQLTEEEYNRRMNPVQQLTIEYPNGNKYWYLNGEQLTEEEFNREMNPVRELTVEQISELLGFEVKVVKG
jgi:membrane carboxypeptidase/penicillin-binding protein PbpC